MEIITLGRGLESSDAGTAWLAVALEAKLEKDDRDQLALSEATVSRGNRAITELEPCVLGTQND